MTSSFDPDRLVLSFLAWSLVSAECAAWAADQQARLEAETRPAEAETLGLRRARLALALGGPPADEPPSAYDPTPQAR